MQEAANRAMRLGDYTAWNLLGTSPGAQVYRIQCNAKYVGGNESQLRSSEDNEANEHAIDCRQQPSLTTPSYDHQGRTKRQYARQVVEPDHAKHPYITND